MKQKYLLILIAICMDMSISFCMEEEVFLDAKEIFRIKTQEAVDIKRVNQGHESIFDNESKFFDSDEEIFETKAGQVFHKFVDDKIINNKINKFSTKIEEKYNP